MVHFSAPKLLVGIESLLCKTLEIFTRVRKILVKAMSSELITGIKKVYSLINKNDFDTLSTMLADASLESDDLTVSTIITGLYLKGLKVEDICDKVIDPGSIIVENALRQGYLTHVETFVSRKLITRATESLNQNKPNGSANGKTALCVNFEDNLPDLGVVMSEVVLRHYGYNVLNTGSHAELGNLQTIIEKKKVDLLFSIFATCNVVWLPLRTISTKQKNKQR